MVDASATRRDEAQDPDWSVYLARGPALTLVWANEGYLRLTSEPHETKGVIGLPLVEVSPLAATRAAELQSVLATGKPQGGTGRVSGAQDGTVEVEWRAYRPLPDHVLVVMYRIEPALNRVVAERFERVAQAQADCALLLEEQRQMAAALKDHQERAAALLLKSQEDAAATVSILETEDIEAAPPETRDSLRRIFDEAAEQLASLQEQAAHTLRQSQQASAALRLEEITKEIEE